MTTSFTQNNNLGRFWVEIAVILWIWSALQAVLFSQLEKNHVTQLPTVKTRGHVEHQSLEKNIDGHFICLKTSRVPNKTEENIFLFWKYFWHTFIHRINKKLLKLLFSPNKLKVPTYTLIQNLCCIPNSKVAREKKIKCGALLSYPLWVAW